MVGRKPGGVLAPQEDRVTPLFTTSWDDGHPLDGRVADLLTKYGQRGTFYVPASAPGPVMERTALQCLATGFEIGAHTMTHGNLLHLSDEAVRAEMADSRRYVEDRTGRACTTFAPPGGRFRRRHVAIAAAIGFCGLRTVELMSLRRPRVQAGIAILPTTLQVFPHAPAAYLRNAAKRGQWANVVTFLAHAGVRELPRAAEALVAAAIARGGVFHLWGHSWEIEERGLWPALETILRAMQAERGHYRAATNQELCEEVLRAESIAKPIADPELS
jgi:peptidoglycan/xylan/chitin deacetylase (PgdA/CDA1 family)